MKKYQAPLVGAIASALVIALLVLFMPPGSARATVTDVTPTATEVGFGETVTFTVTTAPGGRRITATVDPDGPGQALFSDTGTTEAELVTSAGYTGTGTAVFGVRGTAAGEVEIHFSDALTGETITTSLTVETAGVPPWTGNFVISPGSSAGLHAAVWGGGTLAQLLDASPAQTTSIWVMTAAVEAGYIPGAPPFVNARFLAQFPGGFLPPNLRLLLRLR